MKKNAIIILITLSSFIAGAQNVGINGTGAVPDASAMLDVAATDKGILVPRVALLDVTNGILPVNAPLTSLLVWNTNAAVTGGSGVGFYYWNGAIWATFGSGGSSTAWDILGNAGTVDDINLTGNFLGTTDNIALSFRVNNQHAGRIDANGPTFIGYQAGNNNLDATVTGIGYRALTSNTTGIRNTAIGYNSLSSNINGQGNTAVGWNTLSNGTGSYNTAIGYTALGAGVNTGQENTAVGYGALNNNTSGLANTAMGMLTMLDNTTGITNSAFGGKAVRKNTTGNRNTGIGWQALNQNQTGSQNTALGYNCYLAAGPYTNSMALGYNANINASNKIRLGDAAITVIEGQVAYSFPSDGRFKNNVTEEIKGLDFIMRLRPVVYNFDTEKFEAFLFKDVPDSLKQELFEKDYSESTAIRQSGFIAQEVEQAAKESEYNFNGVHKPSNESDNYSVSYSLFVVPLVKAVQEQQKMIEVQQGMIEKQLKMIEELREEMEKLKKKM